MSCKALFFLLAAALLLTTPLAAQSAPGLQVTYASSGLQTLAYNGVVLEDVGQNPADAFHIWHMKATDLNGNILTSGQYGWGENNTRKAWNGAAQTWTYWFVWGSIEAHYFQDGDTLGLRVTEINNKNSGIILDGASIYPLVLHFPQLPAGFVDPAYEQLATNTTGPSVTVADYGAGEVASLFNSASQPLYTGFEPAGGGAYTAIVSSTGLDGMAAFLPRYDRPISPGQCETFTMLLRFAPSGTPVGTLAADVYRTWARTWPSVLSWPDRRIIGSVYLASSPSGDPNHSGGYPNNPRRYFNDSNANDFDIRTSDGLAKFQAKVLAQAAANVQNLKQLNAQGAITWDIEGEQFPQTTSYVCEPDEMAQAAPEMESVISDTTSPYAGSKLDDAYFSIMRSAGFRVGVCIRPQHFTLNADGSAGQTPLPDAQVSSELIRKMKYAHDRWGATLFYIDSSVETDGGNLPVNLFTQAAAALPDSLLIPEETTPAYYAYTAAFKSFIFHGDLGTPAAVYNYYPKAFSVNLVNDADPAKLAQYRPQLTDSIRRGDILVVHADYWQQNNLVVVQMYADAASSQQHAAPPAPSPAVLTMPPASPSASVEPVPSPVRPELNNALTYPLTGQTVAGPVTVLAHIEQTLDAAGSYLMVDGVEAGNARITNPPYAYRLDTKTVSNGTHALQIWAHDINNDVLISDPVNVIVANTP